MAPMDAIWLVFVKIAFAHHFVATHSPSTLPHYKSATGINISYTSKNYLKWWKILLAIHPIVNG